MDATRRGLMAAICGSTVGVAGCGANRPDKSGSDTPPSRTDVTGPASGDGRGRTIVVDAMDGSRHGDGSPDSPYATPEQGVNAASPGDTVRVEPGRYSGPVVVSDGGEPGAPITITGPADAVLTGSEAPRAQPLVIRASHVHLTGLTIDGLLDPDRTAEPDAYAKSPLVDIAPPADSREYLRDIVVAPHGIGNAYAHMVVVTRSRNVEIGPFRVTGLAGANYVLDPTATERHVGEIVYLGTPPDTYSLEAYPWDELDQTRTIHVHHIDNSAGHPHAELVNTKLGTRDILVEYCTDAGGSQNAEPYPTASVRFQSYDATLRWCTLAGGRGHGVHVLGAGADWLTTKFDGDIVEPFDPDRLGTDHRIYGNQIRGYAASPVKLDYVYPSDQLLCENDIAGDILGPQGEVYTQTNCPDDLPDGDGIGHRGGDSPWQ